MKKIVITILLGSFALSALANDLLWGSDSGFTVSDNSGALVATSKTDPLDGAFIQLISAGLNGVIDPFNYFGVGVSGDDVVIATSYSFGGSGLGVKDGKFKYIAAGFDASETDATVYVRVYNEANENYANGVAATITGGVVTHYWESALESFTWNDTGADTQWDFTGGANVQTTTVVPEPATAMLLALGGGLAWLVRLKQRLG